MIFVEKHKYEKGKKSEIFLETHKHHLSPGISPKTRQKLLTVNALKSKRSYTTIKSQIKMRHKKYYLLTADTWQN